MATPSLRRPVFIADFRPAPRALPADPEPVDPVPIHQLRHHFPVRGESVEGGETADGYCFTIIFSAGRLAASYEMLVAFLQEHGYTDVPIPKDVEELKRFRLPPRMRHQLALFGDDGYVHNPVKILFPGPAQRRGSLRLELYDEGAEDHLLRFHRRK